jgi:hypothetical protein
MVAILETLIEKNKGTVIDEFQINLSKVLLEDAKRFRGDLYKFILRNGPSALDDFYRLITGYSK